MAMATWQLIEQNENGHLVEKVVGQKGKLALIK
jgi:hypothetical protein